MTFTYNSSNVGSSGLASVRFYTGETASGTAVLTDEEIQAVLSNIETNHYRAAAICCDNLAAHWASYVDTRNEGLDISASQRSKAYERRAAALRRRGSASASIFVGGRSQNTKQSRVADTDLVQPNFRMGQDDFPGTIASTTGSG